MRVLTAGRDSGNLAKEIEGNPLITNLKELGEIIRFKVPGTQFEAFGREATALIELCEKYLQASERVMPTDFKVPNPSERNDHIPHPLSIVSSNARLRVLRWIYPARLHSTARDGIVLTGHLWT